MRRKDEIGQLALSLDAMSDGLEHKAALAGEIASGDLSKEIPVASEQDVLGMALRSMVDNINGLLGRVHQAADKVDGGAGQIAASSQSLSQGASEQAASLEEIGSSMAEIDSQARSNADNASQADAMAREARKAAEAGTKRMRAMTEAMQEISQASLSISKIIKAIDEIAFQTNLLALNAAVEAARAGHHGKGFAVVAEEVRNLAGRSAQAAEETASLIEGAVIKAERGSRIAEETSGALADILEQVRKTANLLEEISAASTEQTSGIAQVHEGLKQLEQVTLHTTAAAEQTASASESLTVQSGQLRGVLAEFQLRAGEGRQEVAVCGQDMEAVALPAGGEGLPENGAVPAVLS